MLPGMGVSVPGIAAVPTVAPAAVAAPAAVPPVVGSPTFCLLVKNMFDPATEEDEGWELDIKEEMEEVRSGLMGVADGGGVLLVVCHLFLQVQALLIEKLAVDPRYQITNVWRDGGGKGWDDGR